MWIHWWSSVASANRLTCSCVTSCHSPKPRCSPLAATSSSMFSKARMGWPSVLRSAGDVDDLAGHEAGALAHEERRGVRDVLGLTDARDRDRLRGTVDQILERDLHALGGRLGHLGGDEAGRDRVDRDAELAELDREGLGEALQTGLGGGVVGLTAVAESAGGAEVDDAAEAFL